MPLLRRRPVQLLPLPNLDGLAQDAPVFYLKATGEVFLDYEAYAARLSFLLLRQFQCEYSGKTNLDYFSALQSEKAESKVVRERFPDELKGRVLATVQFRVMGRLDALVDLVYERYKDRFFANEKIFVDLGGDKYFAKVSKVFPPANVRSSAPAPSPAASTSTGAPPPEDYASIAHKLGVDLNVDPNKAKTEDDPYEYLYTVQLMDEEHKFEGSFMEVSCKALSRDRLAFSKSILKRYLRECLIRDPAIGSPWMVKPSIARAFSIPLMQSEGELERNAKAKEGKLAKRRKTIGGEEGEEGAAGGAGGKAKATPEPAAKRRKTTESSTPAPTPSAPSTSHAASGAHTSPPAPKKTIKYPIEDLELDAMSIHDGRILRRVNSELPTLPKKPQPKRVSGARGLEGVEENCVERLLETWNMLSVFSKPLFLTPFSLDDYVAALLHDTVSPRCVLLLEIHASLTNIIGTDNSRVLGSTSAVYSHGGAGRGRAAAAKVAGGDGGDGEGTPSATPAPGEGDGDDQLLAEDLTPAAQHAADLAAYEASELNQLVRLGVSYGKRWDRQAKLKYAEGREGWERHLIGALCQRGGPVYLEGFVRIMRRLFEGHPRLPRREGEGGVEGEEVKGENGETEVKKEEGEGEAEGEVKENGAASTAAAAPPAPKPKPKADNGDADEEDDDEDDGASSAAPLAEDTSNPEQAYLSLPLGDKLDVIGYLCTLVMGSKAVRNYVDECDAKLTELRKVRAEVNKERKALFEQKTNLEQGRDTPSTPSGPSGAGLAAALSAPSPLGPGASAAATNGNGSAMDVDSPAPSVSGAAGGDDEEDQLASDAESTAAPSEAGSTMSKKIGDRAAGLAQLREAARAKTKGVIARSTIEDKLKTNSDKDDEVEREFRRFQGVQRCRPLGKDRFHCRYWWFDGVGGMDLLRPSADTAGGSAVVYGAGRLFVQGPSREDWDMIADTRGADGEASEKEMRRRRVEEEVVEVGDQRGLLEPGEWGFYEEDDEIEALQTWLNNKGTRELALKTSLQKWRTLIVAGAQKRQFDAANPDVPRYDAPANSGRRSRAKAEPELLNNYMGYRNASHKY
ncbi:hypothetical protein JCM6882_004486 [Rhodosporidiobolus microsporus]